MITDNRTAEQILAGPPQVARAFSAAHTPGGPVADVQPPGTHDLFEIGKHVLEVEARNAGPRPQPVTTGMLLRAVEAMIYAGIADREEKREEFVKQAADFLLTPPDPPDPQDPQEFALKLEEVVSAALAEHATGCKQCGYPHVQHALHEVRRLAGLLRQAEPGALLPGFEQAGGRVRRIDAAADAPHIDAGPEPADGVRIMVRLGWQQTPTEDFEALFSIATAAAQQAANLRLHDAGDATVWLVLPAEVHDLGMQTTSRSTGDGRVIPLLDALRGGYPMVEVRRENQPSPDAWHMARHIRANMAENLAAWSEDGGHLLRTEPDVEERALIRIRLRATIATCDRILGEKHDDRADADADHRDRMRIADAAREDAAGIEPGQIVRFDGEEYKIPTMVAAEFLDIDDGDHQSKVNVLLRALAGRQG